MTAAIPPERPELTRRDFVKTIGATALVATSPFLKAPAPAETAVARFVHSLDDERKARICFPFDHPLRGRVGHNPAIVKSRIADLNSHQQALCREVFNALCSDGGRERFRRQMDDDYGGFVNHHVAVFGEPGAETPFEWVVTGRHAALRADGLGLSGPIFYGHASTTDNVWRYQAERADAIFKTLDDARRTRVLGLSVGDLDGPRKAMVRRLVEALLSPFADNGVPPSLLNLDAFRLTYFQESVWALEGPAFSCYFHGTPHVHAWLNFGRNMPGV